VRGTLDQPQRPAACPAGAVAFGAVGFADLPAELHAGSAWWAAIADWLAASTIAVGPAGFVRAPLALAAVILADDSAMQAWK